MMDKNILSEINEIYQELESKSLDLMSELLHRTFECYGAWFSGCLDEDEYDLSGVLSCPFPVISVRDVCSVQIHFDEIVVLSKLQRHAALAKKYNKFKKYPFDVREGGINCAKLYSMDESPDCLMEALEDSEEEEFEFHFRLPFDTDQKTIFEFVKLLRREGFEYYEKDE